MDFLYQYGLFFAKAITFVVCSLLLVAGIFSITSKDKGHGKDKLKVKKLNDHFDELKKTLHQKILSKSEYKKSIKLAKKEAKNKSTKRKRIFVLQFDGDIKASAVNTLREEITGLLTIANNKDEVVLLLESPGGVVHGYGLAASQLQRIRQHKIPLTVCVDKVAASGGYLMACVANRILAAPFAIIGSIGVIAQIPNFNRFLKNKNIDFEQVTAGEYKRTITMFGENTAKGREKFKEELEDVHALFKNFISEHRKIDIDTVATGEHWLAKQAHELKLVDELITSDDYLLSASEHSDIFQVTYRHKKSLSEKFGSMLEALYLHTRSIISYR